MLGDSADLPSTGGHDVMGSLEPQSSQGGPLSPSADRLFVTVQRVKPAPFATSTDTHILILSPSDRRQVPKLRPHGSP